MTALPGFPERQELVEHYESRSGRDVTDLAWFEALALWKGAIFCEAIHARYLRGELAHDPFAASLEQGVLALAAAAADVAADA